VIMCPSDIATLLADLEVADVSSAAAAQRRVDDILRPAGALARLDDIAVWVASWQSTESPAIVSPAALVCAGDHGIAASGVSAYPAEVTAAMLGAFRAGVSTINAMARVAGATVDAIDVGVGRPTCDFTVEPAMSEQRFVEAFEAGREAVAAIVERGADLLVVGEMGIGNTTAAAAVCAAVLGGTGTDWVGRGTGVDDEGMRRKVAVVDAGLARVGDIVEPIQALLEFGGAEMVAMAGAVVEARQNRLPVLLDGYVVGAAVVSLAASHPSSLDHCRIAHRSAEPGHSRLIDALSVKCNTDFAPLLDLDMRLGEASGAMAAVPLVAMACAAVVEVPTFAEFFGDA
jgi:nicotinate-nucleotide--dimethylbenzimidazole phosphoribosyltransferase